MTQKRMFSAAIVFVALVVCVSSGVLAQARKTSGSAQKAAQQARPAASDVIASVNGQSITGKQIADELLADQEARLKATNPQFADRVRPVAGSIGALVMKRMAAQKGAPVSVNRADIVAWLIEEKSQIVKEAVQNRIRELAIAQAAKARGVVLTPAQIDKQVAKSIGNARTQLRLQGKSDAQVLADLGYRSDTIRRGVLASLYLEGILQKDMAAKLGHALGPDDYVEGRHILVKVNAQPPAPTTDAAAQPPPVDTESAFAEAKTKIDAIAQEIANKVKTFEQAATDASDDPSKFQEGKLGVFVRGQMVPEFEAVAFSLPVGVVSQPVRSQFGWHLIRVDRLGKDVSADEREQAWQTYVRGRAQGLVSEIMSKAKVVNKIGPPEPMGMPGMR